METILSAHIEVSACGRCAEQNEFTEFRVLDSTGVIRRRLPDRARLAGSGGTATATAVWDGRDSEGNTLPPGEYAIRMHMFATPEPVGWNEAVGFGVTILEHDPLAHVEGARRLLGSTDVAKQWLGASILTDIFRSARMFTTATAELEAKIAADPTSSLVPMLRYWIGDNSFMAGDPVGALATFQDLAASSDGAAPFLSRTWGGMARQRAVGVLESMGRTSDAAAEALDIGLHGGPEFDRGALLLRAAQDYESSGDLTGAIGALSSSLALPTCSSNEPAAGCATPAQKEIAFAWEASLSSAQTWARSSPDALAAELAAALAVGSAEQLNALANPVEFSITLNGADERRLTNTSQVLGLLDAHLAGGSRPFVIDSQFAATAGRLRTDGWSGEFTLDSQLEFVLRERNYGWEWAGITVLGPRGEQPRPSDPPYPVIEFTAAIPPVRVPWPSWVPAQRAGGHSTFEPTVWDGGPFQACGWGGLNYYRNGTHIRGTSEGLDDTYAIDFARWSTIQWDNTTGYGDHLVASESGIVIAGDDSDLDNAFGWGHSNYVFVAVYPRYGIARYPTLRGLPELFSSCPPNPSLFDLMQCTGGMLVYQYLHIKQYSLFRSPGSITPQDSGLLAAVGSSGVWPWAHLHLAYYVRPDYGSSPIQFLNARFDEVDETDFGERFLGAGDNGRCVGAGPMVPSGLFRAFADDDGDGIENIYDNCAAIPNADQTDSDGDGIGDACCTRVPVPPGCPPACPTFCPPLCTSVCSSVDGRTLCIGDDPDNDGFLDNDNCPCDANIDQRDFDGDGIGDVCDPDLDGDGVPNDVDSCPYMNDGTTDFDHDGISDNCDPDDDNDGFADIQVGISCCGALQDLCLGQFAPPPCPQGRDGAGDHDGDGIDTLYDNCPCAWNPSQTDTDGDGCGDACDGDDVTDWMYCTAEGQQARREGRDTCYVQPYVGLSTCVGPPRLSRSPGCLFFGP